MGFLLFFPCIWLMTLIESYHPWLTFEAIDYGISHYNLKRKIKSNRDNSFPFVSGM